MYTWFKKPDSRRTAASAPLHVLPLRCSLVLGPAAQWWARRGPVSAPPAPTSWPCTCGRQLPWFLFAYFLNVLFAIFPQMFQYSYHVPVNVSQVFELIYKNFFKERKLEKKKKKSSSKNLPSSLPALSVWSVYVAIS